MIEEFKQKFEEVKERKRAELREALEKKDIADPITALVVGISWQALAFSAAATAASILLTQALQPKPQKQTVGRLSGALQLMNSEQGIFIPEIYGAGPDFTLVTGSTVGYANVQNATVGGSGAITKNVANLIWNAGASWNAGALTAGVDYFFRFVVGTGYAAAGFTTTAAPVSGNADFKFGIQWNPDGSVSIKYNGTSVVANVTTWTTGQEFTVELRAGRFRLYKGAAEIFAPNFIPPTPTYPLYIGIAMQTNGAGISSAKVQSGTLGDAPNMGRGGIKVPAIIVWTSGIRKLISTTTTGGGKGGGGSRQQTIENITYEIDLGLMFGRGENNLLRLYANADVLIDQFNQQPNPSGVYDPAYADSTYDPYSPPDPTIVYTRPIQRQDGGIAYDGDDVGTGTILGGGSSFAIYPGNATQQPDPVIEADVDSKYGSGSTPAFYNHSLVRISPLSLSRWGGVVPNLTAVWEHSTLKTLDAIYGSLCARSGLLAGDYDFSGLAGIKSRGLLIAGRPFAPAEVMDDPELKLAYQYFVTEADGQIVGYAEGAEPSVTIPDTDIGWLEGDSDLPDILPEVDSNLAAEITLPREVHVKSLDPDNDWEPNTQSAMRQVTDGESVEMLEIQIAQLSDERRATAQRALYQRYVAGTVHRFTLAWNYLYLYPGYRVIITRAEGFTHTIRLTSMTGGVGVLECEGVALEPEVYNQPANGVFPPGYIPPQPVPAQTIALLLDTPLLRDGDATNNNGVGQYVVGTPRTSIDQTWTGFTLYQFKNNEWWPLVTPTVPGIIGTVASVSGLSTDPTAVDYVGRIVVDLYGTDATLTSVTAADVAGGANLSVAGNMVFGFATATQIAGMPNRWELSVLLNGQKETQPYISAVAAGDRFTLVTEAVKFVPMQIEDIDTEMDYRAVTIGQSLGDTATISAVWTANGLRPASVSDVYLVEDGIHDWIIGFTGHPKVHELPPTYTVEIWTDESRDNPAELKRRLPVTEGGATAALLTASTTTSTIGGVKPVRTTRTTYLDSNNVTAGVTQATTLQIVDQIYARFDFTFQLTDITPAFGTNQGMQLCEDGTADPLSWNAGGTGRPVTVEVIAGAGSTLDLRIKNYTTTVATVNYDWAGPLGAGIRFSVLIVGNEYRIYQNFAFGVAPLAVIATPSTGPTFPLRGLFLCGADLDILKINIINGLTLRTLYSAREQVIDFGSTRSVLNLRVYQDGVAPRPDGWPLDVAVQTLGGTILLETLTDDLLIEGGSDRLLKE